MTPTCPKCGSIACKEAGPTTFKCERCAHRAATGHFQRGGPQPSLRWPTNDPEMNPPMLQEERDPETDR